MSSMSEWMYMVLLVYADLTATFFAIPLFYAVFAPSPLVGALSAFILASLILVPAGYLHSRHPVSPRLEDSEVPGIRYGRKRITPPPP